jgi:hypothetical protein
MHGLSPMSGGVISAYLALWLALFPVLQAAHLVFADHGHYFCHEHLRIEDGPPTDSSESHADERSGLASAPCSLRAARPRTSPPDLLLNFSLDRQPALLAIRPAAIELAAMVPIRGPAHTGVLVSQPLVRLAPKTSPPSIGSRRVLP